MNNRNALALLIGAALVGSVATADAGQTTRTEREAAAAAIAKNPDAAIARQPKTMAQADQTMARTKNGSGTAVRVPTELWSTLGVRKDAQGKVLVTETEGDKPATNAAEVPHE